MVCFFFLGCFRGDLTNLIGMAAPRSVFMLGVVGRPLNCSVTVSEPIALAHRPFFDM